MSADSTPGGQDDRARPDARDYQDVKRKGEEMRAQAAEIRTSLMETWEQMLSKREGLFTDRDTRRAALNLMEDVMHARRAEQRAAADRQRAEVEVRASHIKYRRLFDSIDEGFCILEVLFKNGHPCDYRFQEANPAFEKQTGLGNVIGRTIREIAPGQASDERLEIYGKIALTGEARRFEHNGGRVGRTYDVSAFRVDERGRHRVAVLYNDITDRKRREVNLAFLAEIAVDLSRMSSAEEIMQVIGAKVGAFLNLASCSFVCVEMPNDELRVMHGWHLDEAAELRDPLRIIHHLRHDFQHTGRAGETIVVRDANSDERAARLGGASPQIGALVIVPFPRDSAWRHFLAATDLRPRDWRRDEVELFQEVANRVFPRLERAHVEEALRESEERNRIALDAASMAAWDYDVVADSIAWNEQHYRLLGMEPDNQEKKMADLMAFVHPDDRSAVEDALRVGMEESGIYQAEFRIVRTDGVVRWMCGFGKAIESLEGRALRMGGVMYDVTERHEADEALATALQQTRIAQEAAEAANRAKDRFLAVLSHELRTPLTPALMATHMLLEDPQISADTRDVLEMIQRNIMLEGKLVDDLLDLTRITRGTLKLDLTPADMHQVIRHAVEICQQDIKEKKLRVDLMLDASARSFPGDTARLQQVVWNLLKNACKFSPSGSVIQVRTRNEGGQLIMQVTDTGIGLAKEALSRIFEAFTQADEGIMRRFGGLGLGLAISKAVVQAHGGRIWAESEGAGKGTTLNVSLPLPVEG